MGNAASPDAKMFLDHVERFWTDQILGPGPIPSDGLLCGAPEPSCDRPPSGCSGQSRPFPYYLTLRSITPKYDGSEWPTTNQDLCKALALAQSWIMRQVPLEAQLYVGLSENSKTETTPCQKDVMKGVTVRKLKCTTGDCLGTPVLIVHIPASGGAKGNVLIYGHLDKQAVTPKDWTVPPGVCQKQRPFTPYLDAEKKRLYARGASDDGFAMFFAVAAVMALKNQGHACPTVNLIVDFDEEGGSANLPGYLETFQDVLKTLFEADPPYGAKVTYTPVGQGAGWVSPPMKPWLSNALNTASQSLFDNQKTFGRLGDGGTLPLLTTLENLFPGLAFIVTGVSGPGNNQHGPDENLNYEYAQKVAACIAYILSQLPKNVD